MSYERYEDWPEKLEGFLRAAQAKAFVRGSWDCALFAVAAGEAMTGIDFGADYRARYETREEADDLIAANGHADLLTLADSVLGSRLAGVMLAQRGDIVAFETPEGFALGVVDLSGRRFAAVSHDKGLIRVPLSSASFGWRL